MNAALLEKSPRLQRVLSVLSDGREYSTRDIIGLADVCAVNSCIAELKSPVNGFNIKCRQEKKDRFLYRLEDTDEAKKRLEALGVIKAEQVRVRSYVRNPKGAKPNTLPDDNLSLF